MHDNHYSIATHTEDSTSIMYKFLVKLPTLLSLDPDDCVSSPCYPGVACTDLKAPERGYKCGICPPGFTGNGKVCREAEGGLIDVAYAEQRGKSIYSLYFHVRPMISLTDKEPTNANIFTLVLDARFSCV